METKPRNDESLFLHDHQQTFARLAFEKDPITRNNANLQREAPRLPGLTCSHCLRFRPRTIFADAMTEEKGGINSKQPQKRFSVESGLNSRPGNQGYSPWSDLVVDGRTLVWCKICDRYTPNIGPVGSGECSRCASRGRVAMKPDMFAAKRQRAWRNLMRQGFRNAEQNLIDGYGREEFIDDENDYEHSDFGKAMMLLTKQAILV